MARELCRWCGRTKMDSEPCGCSDGRQFHRLHTIEKEARAIVELGPQHRLFPDGLNRLKKALDAH